MSRDKQTEIDELQKCIAENTAVYDSDVAQDVAETLIYAGYRKASEVAREMFEEIEKFNRPPLPRCAPVYIIKANEYVELKKKYTEREKDNE